MGKTTDGDGDDPLPLTELQSVLAFWFEELGPQAWFAHDDALDRTISTRFSRLYHRLQLHVPALHQLTAEQVVATVIVLDQFPRNLFRQSPRSFATDAAALRLSREAVAVSLDRQLGNAMRQFLYMPFMHSENAADQARSLELFAPLGGGAFDAAQVHQRIIARFGRFPHRNVVLSRNSTAEELEFLKTNPGF